MIQITVNLNSLEDIYHPFSKNTLNPTLASFIYEEKEEIIKLIHVNFIAEWKEEKIKNTLANAFRGILFFAGIIILLFIYLIKVEFLHEFLLILGWLAIWESVYDFLFVEMKEKNKRKRYQMISQSKIVFE